ncbi:hypothetical protein HGRIS_006629 [Hohenbuehelia grisea]|uniref:PIH1 N-terminal domain-containing protein n=1 Tax=Hohenbuehelia grisea TaxID=104357 RepID=A0ABR3J9L0_9AGAR
MHQWASTNFLSSSNTLMSLPTTRVTLEPIPGFCIKSSLAEAHSYIPKSDTNPPQNVLEVKPSVVPLPKGLKVFVNIAWDKNVPAAPEGSEEAIRKAMEGDDIDETNPDGWYVPVVVAQGRLDKDKAGQPSLVYDCVYNPSVKSRTLRDPDFKIFLIELALQRIEAQSLVSLSRQIKTPNIAAKGKLEKRTVLIPSVLYESRKGDAPNPDPNPAASVVSLNTSTHNKTSGRKPLIEEVSASSSKPPPIPKSILKKPTQDAPDVSSLSLEPSTSGPVAPVWTWSKEPSPAMDKIKIVVQVPGVTPSHISSSTLDVEAQRFILSIPPLFELDVRLDIPDAEIVANTRSLYSSSRPESSDQAPNNALTLKRQRDLDVDGARAEWRVQEGILVVYA